MTATYSFHILNVPRGDITRNFHLRSVSHMEALDADYFRIYVA